MAIRAPDGANKDNKISLRPIWEEAKDQLVDCAFNPRWQLKGPLKHKKHDLGLNIE